MQSKINQFVQDCKDKGLNVTFQRMAIYKRLLNRLDHPTAEDLYQEVIKEYPMISRATVYKNLETLFEHNLIAKVTHLHDAARYDGKQEHHHHLVCVRCKAIFDIQSERLDNLQLPNEIDPTFKVYDYRIQFDGLCQKCQS